MIKSMQSGVSGLRVHKTKMDVIANNIANVNTNGFQSSSVSLAESFSQTIEQARNDRNAMQVGSGVSIAAINRSTAQGAQRVVDGEIETMSNTDLTKEITDMIITQRSFEANARSVTMADVMLEELVNLKK